jgi:hypothetical protein
LLLTLLAGGSTNCLLDTGPTNMPPTVQITGPDQPLYRQKVTFTANVHDPDQSTASLDVAWYVGADCGHATAGTPICRASQPGNDQCQYTPQTLDSICVVVRVTDRYGATTTASRVFDVQDRPPVAAIERTSPVSTDAILPLFSKLVFSAAGSTDPDDDDAQHLTYTWTVTQPDGSSLSATDCPSQQTPAICSFAASIPGKYHVQVTATDARQLDNSASLDVVIAQDQRPTAAIQRTSPLSTATPLPLFSTLTFSAAQSTDPDMVNGDTLTFAWKVTQPDGTDLSAATCPSPQTPAVCTFTAANPGTYHVQLTATDSSKLSSADSLDVAIAQDQPPCIVGFSPTTLSTIGFANQSMTFQVSNVSDDGDPYTGSGPTTGTFIWSYRTSTNGAFMRMRNLYNSNRMDFGPGSFVIGDVVQIRVEYQDRVGRSLSSCDANADRCELVPGCAQWVTWTVYFL